MCTGAVGNGHQFKHLKSKYIYIIINKINVTLAAHACRGLIRVRLQLQTLCIVNEMLGTKKAI